MSDAKSDSAVALAEKLRIKVPHQVWAGFTSDHFGLVLEALEKVQGLLAAHPHATGIECSEYCEAHALGAEALAAVAEAAKKALA